jgi:hypothetical protein
VVKKRREVSIFSILLIKNSSGYFKEETEKKKKKKTFEKLGRKFSESWKFLLLQPTKRVKRKAA